MTLFEHKRPINILSQLSHWLRPSQLESIHAQFWRLFVCALPPFFFREKKSCTFNKGRHFLCDIGTLQYSAKKCKLQVQDSRKQWISGSLSLGHGRKVDKDNIQERIERQLLGSDDEQHRPRDNWASSKELHLRTSHALRHKILLKTYECTWTTEKHTICSATNKTASGIATEVNQENIGSVTIPKIILATQSEHHSCPCMFESLSTNESQCSGLDTFCRAACYTTRSHRPRDEKALKRNNSPSFLTCYLGLWNGYF